MKTQTSTTCYFDPVTDICIYFQHADSDEQNWLAGASMVIYPVSGQYELPADYWPLGKTAEEMLVYALSY